MCVCVCVCMRACVRVCAYVRVSACVSMLSKCNVQFSFIF